MERDHEFAIDLPGEGTFVVKLLTGVQVQESSGSVVGRWSAFDLEAESDSEANVYQALLGELTTQIGRPGSPEYEPFAAYVRENGALLSDGEAVGLQLARLRDISTRWRVSDDEQYMIRLWQDAVARYDSGAVTVSAFELEGKGDNVIQAVRALGAAVNEACGESDAPGPRFDEITRWVRSHGERVTVEVLAQEARDNDAYLVARDKLSAITPEDIAAESSTGVPLLVDFWAAWCQPCRIVTPILAGLAEQWAGRIVVRKIDVDHFEGVWERFNFRGIPAMLLFRDGQEIHRVLGFGGKAQLLAELEPHLA